MVRCMVRCYIIGGVLASSQSSTMLWNQICTNKSFSDGLLTGQTGFEGF